MNDYELARADRVARYREYAANARARAEAANAREHAILDMIPTGQPILVGHHSERGHRRDLARADGLMRRYLTEIDKADYWTRKADALERGRAVSGRDPAAVAKLRAKLADIEATQARYKAINAQLRKGAALAELELTPEDRRLLIQVRDLTPWEGKGYAAKTRVPAYALSNLSAEARRIKQRVLALEKEPSA